MKNKLKDHKFNTDSYTKLSSGPILINREKLKAMKVRIERLEKALERCKEQRDYLMKLNQRDAKDSVVENVTLWAYDKELEEILGVIK